MVRGRLMLLRRVGLGVCAALMLAGSASVLSAVKAIEGSKAGAVKPKKSRLKRSTSWMKKKATGKKSAKQIEAKEKKLAAQKKDYVEGAGAKAEKKKQEAAALEEKSKRFSQK